MPISPAIPNLRPSETRSSSWRSFSDTATARLGGALSTTTLPTKKRIFSELGALAPTVASSPARTPAGTPATTPTVEKVGFKLATKRSFQNLFAGVHHATPYPERLSGDGEDYEGIDEDQEEDWETTPDMGEGAGFPFPRMRTGEDDRTARGAVSTNERGRSERYENDPPASLMIQVSPTIGTRIMKRSGKKMSGTGSTRGYESFTASLSPVTESPSFAAFYKKQAPSELVNEGTVKIPAPKKRGILRAFSTPGRSYASAAVASRPIPIPSRPTPILECSRKVSFTDKDDIYLIGSSTRGSVKDTVAAFEELHIRDDTTKASFPFIDFVAPTTITFNTAINPSINNFTDTSTNDLSNPPSQLTIPTTLKTAFTSHPNRPTTPPKINSKRPHNRTAINSYPWTLIHTAIPGAQVNLTTPISPSSPADFKTPGTVSLYVPPTNAKYTSVNNPDFDRRKVRTWNSPIRGHGGRLLDDVEMTKMVRKRGEGDVLAVGLGGKGCLECGDELRDGSGFVEGREGICGRCCGEGRERVGGGDGRVGGMWV